MIKEFKEFAVKGNMIDMAVGIIIGAAFGTVVKSLVDDIIMPVISGMLKVPDFSNLFIMLQRPEITEGIDMTSITAVREAGGVALGYGLFVNAVIAFLLVAIALFFVIRGINALKKEKAKEVEAAPSGPTELELLSEIRDALKK